MMPEGSDVRARAGARPGLRHASRHLLRWLRRKDWDEHVGDLEQMVDTAAFRALRDRIIALADLQPGDEVLDVGSGTGLLALAAAPLVARVSALDVSPAMCAYLERKVRSEGVENVETVLAGADELPLADCSFDVVISNYCFHHLGDAEKLRALAEVRRVLRPGGRLVFADMMFGLKLSDPRNREVVTLLVKRILRAGAGGVMRLLKNATRVVAGRWEHPASVEWWRDALAAGGFVQIDVHALHHEGGIALARRPQAAGHDDASPAAQAQRAVRLGA